MSATATWVEDCLFCRGVGHSGGEEHVLSRSLGNHAATGLVGQEIVLAEHEICHDCNSGPLSTADDAMTRWGPLSIAKTLLTLPNKRGRYVDAVHDSAWQLGWADGILELTAVADLSSAKKNTAMARGMCKVAVETACLNDRLDARSPHWDVLRRAALGDPLPPSLGMHAYFAELGAPRPLLRYDLYSERPDPLRLAFTAEICGITVVLSVGANMAPAAGWVTWTVGDDGQLTGGLPFTQMRFTGTYDSATPLHNGPDEDLAGRGSRLPTASQHQTIVLWPEHPSRPRGRGTASDGALGSARWGRTTRTPSMSGACDCGAGSGERIRGGVCDARFPGEGRRDAQRSAAPAEGMTQFSWADQFEHHVVIEHVLVDLMAGLLAEAELRGDPGFRPNIDFGPGDLVNSDETFLAHYLKVRYARDERPAEFERIVQETQSLIRQQWQALSAIADALVAECTVTGDRIQEIVAKGP